MDMPKMWPLFSEELFLIAILLAQQRATNQAQSLPDRYTMYILKCCAKLSLRRISASVINVAYPRWKSFPLFMTQTFARTS